jgi:hypothetical protein
MFLTASAFQGRTLGTSTVETHPKKTAVFVTGNRLTMSSDMRRRSLVVDFFLRQVRAEVRQIRRPLDERRILEVRPQILGSLYALVRSWVEANKPPLSRVHPSFVEWSNTIGAIVEHAGFGCPIPQLDTASDVDPETADMERLMGLLNAESRRFGRTFKEVVDTCRENGLFDGRLPANEAARRGNTEFGRLLTRFDNREFPGGLRFRVLGVGHARRYSVETFPGVSVAFELSEDDADGADHEAHDHEPHDMHDQPAVESGTAVAA